MTFFDTAEAYGPVTNEEIDTDTTFDPMDFRNASPRFTPEARAANRGLVEALTRIAEREAATPAQLALAWLLHSSRGSSRFPARQSCTGSRNLGAGDVTLTAADLCDIDDAGLEDHRPRRPAPGGGVAVLKSLSRTEIR